MLNLSTSNSTNRPVARHKYYSLATRRHHNRMPIEKKRDRSTQAVGNQGEWNFLVAHCSVQELDVKYRSFRIKDHRQIRGRENSMNTGSIPTPQPRFRRLIGIIGTILILAAASWYYTVSGNLLKPALLAIGGVAYICLLLFKPQRLALWLSLFIFALISISMFDIPHGPTGAILFAGFMASFYGGLFWGFMRLVRKGKLKLAMTLMLSVSFILVLGFGLIYLIVVRG